MKNRITSTKIEKLNKNQIFVFGSNKDGIFRNKFFNHKKQIIWENT